MASMNAAQNAAFAAGSGVTPATVLVAIAGITITLAFVWVVWLTYGIFGAWQSGRATLFDLLWRVLRGCVVLMVLGFYLR